MDERRLRNGGIDACNASSAFAELKIRWKRNLATKQPVDGSKVTR